ncbi:MAG: queuosine precursor transporter [Bacteroidales bacterium]|nr:queuosine precursor transporter [Bacteroidales bacterium]
MFDYGEHVHDKYTIRREAVFIVLAGFFLGTLAVLNILGISKQIDLSFDIFGRKIPFILFVGVLPYPITFLCTDFISELYGRRRANQIVWVGFLLNAWVIFILWLGGKLSPVPAMGADGLPALDNPMHTFYQIRKWNQLSTIASMIAYLTAQFVDVYIFHYFRKLTKGKHLWLRNNGSTLTSQLVDSISVTTITYFFAKSAIHIRPGETTFYTILILIASSYIFKMVAALLDTIPFYIGVKFLCKYLNIDPNKEFKEELKEDEEIHAEHKQKNMQRSKKED